MYKASHKVKQAHKAGMLPEVVNHGKEELKDLKDKIGSMRKIFFFIWSLFLLLQLTGCQGQRPQNSYANDSGNHFRVVWNELYYNGKSITRMPIADFFKIINSENYRVTDYSRKGSTSIDWYWMDKMLHACASTSADGREVVSLIKRKISTHKPLTYIDDLSHDYVDYNSIEEIIAQYGMYDSIRVVENPPLNIKNYIWDDWGFEVSTENDTVRAVSIYPLPNHLKIAYRPMEYDTPEDSIERRKKYNQEISRYPATAFRGKFSWEENTVDFAKTKWNDWNKIVQKLGLADSDYDAPQDEKHWAREIRMPKVYVEVVRLDNEYELTAYPSVTEVGFRVNFVEWITIALAKP